MFSGNVKFSRNSKGVTPIECVKLERGRKIGDFQQ